MSSEELIKEACRRLGCEESIFCFGGKQGILCAQVIAECRALRKIEIEKRGDSHRMKIEDQNVSLDLAQEMKERGVAQDSAFAWYQYANGKPYITLKALQNSQDSIATYHDGYAECPKEICNAFTVAELGEMLPTFYTSWRTAETWACADELDQHDGKGLTAKTEADARAKMLIYLIKEGLVRVEEIGE